MRQDAKRRRVERQAAGLCVDCGERSELGQARCLVCSSEDRKGLPQPIRSALTKYQQQQEQRARDAQAYARREFINRHLYLISDERTKAILQMRYGYSADTCKTLDEVGKLLGVTRERVRQIQVFAEEKIAMFTIEKDIPIPAGKGRMGEIKDTLLAMDVGDSFVIPTSGKQVTITQAAKALGMIVVTRKVSDTERRVWLVSKDGNANNGKAG